MKVKTQQTGSKLFGDKNRKSNSFEQSKPFQHNCLHSESQKNKLSFCTFQVQLRKGYGIPDLKLDIAAQYMKAGVKNIGTVFLMTDAQVSDEKFLVLINDLLASGEIPDLFPDDEVENIIGGK